MLVQGSLISKSLGIEISETSEFSSIITINITSALLPEALPLLSDELGLLSSLPITRYEVKILSILFVELLTNISS